jgi:hypothetical protein
MGLFSKLFRSRAQDDSPPKPKWKPNLPIDVDKIIERAKYYTGSKLQLAVLEYGTVIYFSQQVENVEKNALEIINKIYNSHPDFNPLEMDDGNYMIEYSQPAFTIVFKEEVKDYWDYIDANYKDGICAEEVLLNNEGEANVFDNIGKLCLFGRAKMFIDAQKPNVVRVFNPIK